MPNPHAPTAPTINLNGSHGPTLVEQWGDAAKAIYAAAEALQAVLPHGRDYPQSGSMEARARHLTHMAALDAAYEYASNIHMDLYDQQSARERTRR